MTAITIPSFEQSIAQAIYTEIQNRTSNYYVFTGKNTDWSSEPTPDTPLNSQTYLNSVKNNIIEAKLLDISDISLIIRRIDWEVDKVFAMFDDSVSDLRDTDYYCLASNYCVYKCLFNNNDAASTVEPTGTDYSPVEYADGYIWKFMYSIDSSLRTKFLTLSWMPVMTVVNNQFYSNGSVSSVTVSNPGSGYTTATVTITGDGTGAEFTAVIDGGQITSVIVDSAGYGYTYMTLSVTGDGTGAVLTPVMSTGHIDTQQANVELLAIDGSLSAIEVSNTGSGYTTATVTITGDGTGATATATLNSGLIEKIILTNMGSGYTWATANISGDGTGATARVILSPKGGHGKNAVNEFCPTLIMTYSNFNTKNNIPHTFRQTGMLRNPTKYKSQERFTGAIAKAHFEITGTINPSLYPVGSIINKSSNQKYVILTSETNKLRVSSIDGAVPVAADILKNDSSQQFTVTVLPPVPNIDKFSGQIILVDNHEEKEVSDLQSATVRMLIGEEI